AKIRRLRAQQEQVIACGIFEKDEDGNLVGEGRSRHRNVEQPSERGVASETDNAFSARAENRKPPACDGHTSSPLCDGFGVIYLDAPDRPGGAYIDDVSDGFSVSRHFEIPARHGAGLFLPLMNSVRKAVSSDVPTIVGYIEKHAEFARQ